MLVDIDYDKIAKQALEDINVYAPNEIITQADQEATVLRLSQMLNEDFLVRHLTERLRPLYGIMPVQSASSPSNRFLALDFALRHPAPSPKDFVERAKSFLAFLEGDE